MVVQLIASIVIWLFACSCQNDVQEWVYIQVIKTKIEVATNSSFIATIHTCCRLAGHYFLNYGASVNPQQSRQVYIAYSKAKIKTKLYLCCIHLIHLHTHIS
ncbi:hypothetical protein BD408DRAFT_408268 [Parasitella parasitica]|nr:hypothetical protein BD408DRAFT_408268 [Parasitella parasitica]